MNADRKIKLTRKGHGTYVWGPFEIVRKEWIMPFASVSFVVYQDGTKVDDCDTLKEAKQVLADWRDEFEAAARGDAT